MDSLTAPQAERTGVRINRLTSQLASVSPPVRDGLLDEMDYAD